MHAMMKLVCFLVVVATIQWVGAQEMSLGGNRKLRTDFGPICTNSYSKSLPGWKADPKLKYNSCCDKSKGYICATYKGNSLFSTYATCMTQKACLASNGGVAFKFPGWDCRPLNGNPFPECQNFIAP